MKRFFVYATDMKQELKNHAATKRTYQRDFPLQGQISWAANQVKVAMEHREGQTVFCISLDYSGLASDDDSLSSLRERFFSVSSELEALRFLVVTGGLIFDPMDLFPRSPSTEERHEITWEEFKGYQDLARFLAVNGFLYDETSPVSWLHDNVPARLQAVIDSSPIAVQDWASGKTTRDIELDGPSRSQRVKLWIKPSSTFVAIIASLWLDRLAGDSFRQCRLRGCEKVYSMKGQREDKNYCCTDHARHASIRRSREKKKAATKQARTAVKNGK